MAKLLYGTGLWLMECVRLRVKDVEFEQNQVTVREGKGFKDRVTMLPGSLKGPLAEHLKRVKLLHEQDLAAGQGRVYLPYALSQKYPAADREWGWQYVFPAASLSRDPRGGMVRRHHVGEQGLAQKPVSSASGLPGISCAFPLAVLMFREDDAGSLGQPAGFSGRVSNGSMVPWQVQAGTMVLPGLQEGARCHSQYRECLYKPPQTEGRRPTRLRAAWARQQAKPPQSHLHATSKPPQCVLLARR